MCGVGALVCLDTIQSSENKKICEDIRFWIRNRGPDFFGEVHEGNGSIFLFSSVLYLRGSHLTKQPLVSPEGNILLWNGEVFGGIDVKEQLFSKN